MIEEMFPEPQLQKNIEIGRVYRLKITVVTLFLSLVCFMSSFYLESLWEILRYDRPLETSLAVRSPGILFFSLLER